MTRAVKSTEPPKYEFGRRLAWAPGDAAQCDLWLLPRIPLEGGTAALLPVLVMAAAYSRLTDGAMLPTRRTSDLLLGMG